MEDVTNFMEQTAVDDAVQETKKRKKNDQAKKKSDEREDLRKRAKFHCACPEQWRTVSKYSNQRLQDFIENKQYEMDKSMQESVFSFIHKSVAIVLDMVGKADGHIEERVLNDLSLRESIEYEMVEIIKILNNKVKIATLCAIDFVEGKRDHMKTLPSPIQIKDVSNNDSEENKVLLEDSVFDQTRGEEEIRDTVWKAAERL